MQCWQQGTPDEFWAEFSENGKRLGYKAILLHLTAQHIAEDDRLVQLAKEEFGTKFLEVFSYVKNGKEVVKVKHADIARQYRRIKGIEGDDEDREN